MLINASAFKSALLAVLPAYDRTSPIPAFRCVYLDPTPDGVHLVATTGERLHSAWIAAPGYNLGPVCLPGVDLRRLAASLPATGDVDLGVVQGAWIVNGMQLLPVHATFPDYQSAIPARARTVVKFDPQALRKALQALKHADYVRLTVGVTYSRITVDGQEHPPSLPCATSGKLQSALFNPRFLLDAIKLTNSGTLELGAYLCPAVMRADGRLALIAPARE